METIRCSRYQSLQAVVELIRELLRGYGAAPYIKTLYRPHQHRRRLQAEQLSVGDRRRTASKSQIRCNMTLWHGLAAFNVVMLMATDDWMFGVAALCFLVTEWAEE